MSQMSEEQYLNQSWQKYDPRPDQERKAKSDMRRFWFLSVPLGAACGAFALMLTDAGNAFWVVWLLATVIIQSCLEGK